MLVESIQLYKRLIPFVLPHWKRFCLACVCTLPLSLCTAGLVFLMKPAIDDVFLKKDISMLMLIPLAIIALAGMKGLFQYSYNYLMGSAGSRIINDCRNKIYTHLQSLSVSFFMNNPTGVLMSRVTNDVNMLQRSINSGLIDIFRETMTALGLVAVLFKQDLQLACLAMLVLPWAAIPIMRFGKKTRRFSTRGQEKVGRISTLIHETISGCRIVKAFGMEQYEIGRFDAENRRIMKLSNKRLKIRALSGPVMELIGGIAGAAVMVYGGFNVLSGTLTTGEFFSFLTALFLLYGPIRTVSGAYQDIQEGLAAAKRIFEVLDETPDVQEKPGAKALPPVKGAVRFTDVGFAYGQEPVLRSINLTVRPGEVIAVVGMTGSGKTTMVNLLPRFFDVSAGTITIDGQNVRDVTLHSLRSQIALVSQHPYLFNDSVHNNICYGDPGQSRERVVEAARQAYALDFIEQLPEGFDTVVGEHGTRLSGGQRQRLAIARAILKDAPILLLDEATASLDVQTEKKIQHSLERLISTRTAFIISHRLSTIRNADRIIVLQGGMIVEEGAHDALFRQGGEYTKLYSIFLQDEQRSAAGGTA